MANFWRAVCYFVISFSILRRYIDDDDIIILDTDDTDAEFGEKSLKN